MLKEFNIGEKISRSYGGIKKMKLKVELFRYDTLVFGKILEQDESLREKREVISRSDYEIDSFDGPGINSNTLYIRGRSEKFNDDVIFYNFNSKKAAEAWCKNIKKLIDELNNEASEEDGIVRVM